MSTSDLPNEANELDIAIIGMSGRFPGADTLDEYWNNLVSGIESITFFSDDDLRESGIDPAILGDPNYVKAAPVLKHPGQFDTAFFGYSPREAQFMDPQHRLFLECAWEALEQAGYDPDRCDMPIGVYGGAAANTYLLFSGVAPYFVTEYLPTLIGNDSSFLATRVSYKMNLTGPSVSVQTACSTSLVAVHFACQSLLNEECDIALAGGVSVRVPHRAGHFYAEGSVFTRDGHCRTFDASAGGTIFGSGVGVVALKRLSNALEDGDYVHAVIKGSAINNDGASKVDYTAPSVNSQADVIIEALASADVDAGTISYVEAHGTGTYLGDPIEVTALTKAFRSYTDQKGQCAIGSVKTNIGHLDAAAGMAGLMKTVLAMQHRQLPPILHFEKPNPEIDFANSPFYVNTTLSEWKSDGPRRAGISSLGIGGTNGHVVLEEAPERPASSESRPQQLLVLSARSNAALDRASANLAAYLRQHPDVHLADVAYTLQTGRKMFARRRVLVAASPEDAAAALEAKNPKRIASELYEAGQREVAFMFSGQGSQYPNMGRELYDTEPLFQEHVDRCADLLRPHLGFDLRDVLYPADDSIDEATERLKRTAITQPALFTIEYALAQVWMAWGIQPAALVGHSIGEYVAACLAGVFSLEDALKVVATRGQLMDSLPGGAMVSLPLPAEQVQPFLNERVVLAAVNAPSLTVVSGDLDAIAELEQRLTQEGLDFRRLHTSHAFHSPMMDPILDEFTQTVQKMQRSAPEIPFVSNLTGTWITDTQATDPRYWANHLRQAVRFADCVGTLLQEPGRVLLEVGPGTTLSTLAQQHRERAQKHTVLASMRHPAEHVSDVAFLLNSLGRLWMAGVMPDWSAFYADENRLRLPLPTYPFEQQEHWMKAGKQRYGAAAQRDGVARKADVADWFYLPSWKRTPIPQPSPDASEQHTWLLFTSSDGPGAHLARSLHDQGQTVVSVRAGQQFAPDGSDAYTINPQQREDYIALLAALQKAERMPTRIVHLWGVGEQAADVSQAQDRGFYSLLFLAQALAEHFATEPLHLRVVTSNVYDVTGDETLHPAKATVVGLCKVIPQEFPHITCQHIDTVGTADAYLLAELLNAPDEPVVAYRGNSRRVQTFEPTRVEALPATPRLRQNGVYLITGGLGGLGLLLSNYLARTTQARLVLTGRSGMPSRETWDAWLASHDEADRLSQRIRSVRALEAAGAEVLVLKADVTDRAQMQQALELTQEHFGALHGVIHAAGVVDSSAFTHLNDSGRTACEQHIQPKVYGTLALQEVLQGRTLDFCMLMSSISAMLGGLGYGPYAAANSYMDALASQQSRLNGTPWISVNWDLWRVESPEKGELLRGASLAELGIDPDNGTEAFRRALHLQGVPQVIVSTGDLQARIDQWVKRDDAADGADEGPDDEDLQERPELASDYAAPRSDTERSVAQVWQEYLGIAQIGIHDDFADLGGHSLLATQILARLSSMFRVRLQIRNFYDTPTVADLAAYIESQRTPDRSEEDTINQALKEVEGLSDEELEALLGDE
jgi:acyl transferase domain-containing protein/acyl carrier protein